MLQVSEAPNGMHAQQLQQQLNQMPQQQQQQTSMPTQSSAPTVELKAPNNQSQTVQLDLSNVNNMLQLQVQCRSTPASPSLVPSQACCRSEKTSATLSPPLYPQLLLRSDVHVWRPFFSYLSHSCPLELLQSVFSSSIP